MPKALLHLLRIKMFFFITTLRLALTTKILMKKTAEELPTPQVPTSSITEASPLSTTYPETAEELSVPTIEYLLTKLPLASYSKATIH